MPDVAAHSTGFAGPARNAFAITPDDGTDLAFVTRALYVGAAGNVSVILIDDTDAVLFVGATAGLVLPIRVKRVQATGTTATSIVGIY